MQHPAPFPPAQHQRIDLIDALRGFALLGILLIHALEYFELYWINPPPETLLHTTLFFLLSGKAYAVLALLFGVSFYLMVERSGSHSRVRFAWRLLLLFALGYLHGLVYYGDILQVLAVLGFILLLVQPLGQRGLLVFAMLCLLQPTLWAQFFLSLDGAEAHNQQPLHWQQFGELFKHLANASLLETLQSNAWNSQVAKWLFFLEGGRAVQLLGLFALGLVVGRLGFFSQLQRYATLRRCALGGFALTTLCIYALQQWLGNHSELGGAMSKWYLTKVLDNYLGAAMALGGTCLFIEVYLWQPGYRLLRLLAPCGTMGLSVYVLPALICVPLFYPFGLGWYQTMSQASAFVFGLGLFAVFMVFAQVWLRYFRYGPLEWLWRCGTHLRWLPIRHK